MNFWRSRWVARLLRVIVVTGEWDCLMVCSEWSCLEVRGFTWVVPWSTVVISHSLPSPLLSLSLSPTAPFRPAWTPRLQWRGRMCSPRFLSSTVSPAAPRQELRSALVSHALLSSCVGHFSPSVPGRGFHIILLSIWWFYTPSETCVGIKIVRKHTHTHTLFLSHTYTHPVGFYMHIRNTTLTRPWLTPLHHFATLTGHGTQ